jgi:hypothetical protein
MPPMTTDMTPDEFRQWGYAVVDLLPAVIAELGHQALAG